MLLAEMLLRVSISYQNSPAKDSDSKVKVKFLTSGHFYTKSHTKINLRIRLTSAKDLVEVEAELGKNLWSISAYSIPRGQDLKNGSNRK